MWPVLWAVVAGFVILLYVRTVGYGLYLDDQHHARPWTAREVLGTFHGPFDPLGIEPIYYRPLVVVTFAADWAVWGYRASGYHVTNIALHTIAAVAVLELLRRTGVRWWAALAGALLFAAIPANVATVVYISERSDAMVAIFTIAGMLCLHRYSRDRRWRWLILLDLCFVLAVGSKEVGIAMLLTAG
ncbi:MAG: phospholipid carrier-dependent glycosyltransferase, partial [Ilumatobacteraceae bacterium]